MQQQRRQPKRTNHKIIDEIICALIMMFHYYYYYLCVDSWPMNNDPRLQFSIDTGLSVSVILMEWPSDNLVLLLLETFSGRQTFKPIHVFAKHTAHASSHRLCCNRNRCQLPISQSFRRRAIATIRSQQYWRLFSIFLNDWIIGKSHWMEWNKIVSFVCDLHTATCEHFIQQ